MASTVNIAFKGKEYTITDKDLVALNKYLCRQRWHQVDVLELSAKNARIIWNSLRSRWSSLFVAELVNGFSPPPEAVVSRAEAAAKQIKAAYDSGDPKQLDVAIRAGVGPISDACAKIDLYRDAWYEGLDLRFDALETTAFTASVVERGLFISEMGPVYGNAERAERSTPCLKRSVSTQLGTRELLSEARPGMYLRGQRLMRWLPQYSRPKQ